MLARGGRPDDRYGMGAFQAASCGQCSQAEATCWPKVEDAAAGEAATAAAAAAAATATTTTTTTVHADQHPTYSRPVQSSEPAR